MFYSQQIHVYRNKPLVLRQSGSRLQVFLLNDLPDFDRHENIVAGPIGGSYTEWREKHRAAFDQVRHALTVLGHWQIEGMTVDEFIDGFRAHFDLNVNRKDDLLRVERTFNSQLRAWGWAVAFTEADKPYANQWLWRINEHLSFYTGTSPVIFVDQSA